MVALVDALSDATAVQDAFHVVKPGTQVIDAVHRRVQQATTGHRGRRGNPLFGIQTILRASAKDTTDGRRRAEKLLDPLHTCPIPEVARLSRTPRRWRQAFLAYFSNDRASNGGTEAVNGIIELRRRIARGHRNRENHHPRMLLVAGGLTPLTPPEVRRALNPLVSSRDLAT